MAQFIERFAVAGGVADVSKAFIESMEGMGVEILEVTDIRLEGTLTVENNSENAKSRGAKRRAAANNAAGDDGQPGSQSIIRFQIDIMALSDEKTRIMVRLILSGINIGQLSGKLDKIGQGLIGLITAKFPAIEITLNPIQLPDAKPKTLPRAVLIWGGVAMTALLFLVISLAWFSQGYRNFEKSNFASESLRNWDTKQQNMVFDTKNSSASGERAAPPEDRFIKVSALPNQVGKNCVVSLTVSNRSPLSISHLEFSIRMYDRDGRDLGSNVIDIESPSEQTIIKNTKIMKFEKVFCSRIARAVIHEIDECIVDGSSSIACHRYLKPDPRSIIPFAR